MKNTLISFIVLLLFSCSENTKTAIGNREEPFPFFQNKNSESQSSTVRPVIENGKINIEKTIEELKKNQAYIEARFKEVNIEVPNGRVSPALINNSKLKYITFLEKFKEDRILPLFRNKYSKLILVEYGLIDSDNYKDIEYFLKELLTSQVLDLALIKSCLLKLKEGIATNEFNKIKQLTIEKVKESIIVKKQMKDSFEPKPNGEKGKVSGNLNGAFMLQLKENTIANIVSDIDKSEKFKEEIMKM